MWIVCAAKALSAVSPLSIAHSAGSCSTAGTPRPSPICSTSMCSWGASFGPAISARRRPTSSSCRMSIRELRLPLPLTLGVSYVLVLTCVFTWFQLSFLPTPAFRKLSKKPFFCFFPSGGRPQGSSSSSKRSGSRSSERPVDPAPRSNEGTWLVGSASSTSGGVSQPPLGAVAACQQGQFIICNIVYISILSAPLVLLPW